MQVIFVGGASSVGASCVAVEIAGQWILIDAGVRVDRKSDPLPDLALLEGKDIRAIFVTHAHADHIGALPLVHQAFPTVPIFASRATGLLMEVMLSDALKIMNRRAAEEMEIPLYPPELVGSMLSQLRPLPIGETVTLPQLPGVSIRASRAGHIAGAVSFAFTGSDGTLVLSGDISMTPQRTVLGAVPPPVPHCDLLILESTYGSRLHPNRQQEEQRLSQAVAENIARGGHTLIPCFGLGRGQEILLVLQAAQERGQISDFPIYVDGLIRRVCNTYLLLPDALPPTVQRQIRRGYLPFNGGTVTFVRDEHHRERILAGPPACILSSSGMLTGGPSVWYAKRLVPQEQAAILISGYQDSEAPGKKLLDLAEHKRETMELDGVSLPVRCHVAKFNLSAHADGSELASYAAALKPRKVALVHGDEEARQALRRLLVETEVLLPENGSTLIPQDTGSHPRKQKEQVQALPTLPIGIGQGRELTSGVLPEIWQAISQVPSLRIVTARELACTWFGQADEAETTEIMSVLDEDYEQRYFVRQQALEEAYRVRGQSEEEPGDFLSDLVGKILLVEISPKSSKPVLCQSIEPGARIRVQHPRNIDFIHSRYPFNTILDILGEPTEEMVTNRFGIPNGLDELIKAARRKRRSISAHTLAHLCQENATYTLGDLCQLAGVSATALADRLAMAKMLAKNPLIFTQQRTLMEGEGLALYMLAPEWSEALEEPEDLLRPDQQGIQEIIQKHLGEAPDLYRRSVNPNSGEITLAFHFPAVATRQYGEQIAAIAQETGGQVHIASQTHQGELIRLAQRLLPAGLSAHGFPSIYHESLVIQIKCAGTASDEAIEAAQHHFYEQTGWRWELDVLSRHQQVSPPTPTPTQTKARMDQYKAIQSASLTLNGLPGFLKVGADPERWLLSARFHFPSIARQRYAEHLAEVEAQTGWRVQVPDGTHQEALTAMAYRVLPDELTASKTSIYQQHQQVVLTCTGVVAREIVVMAEQQFKEETGWSLSIIIPNAQTSGESTRMTQGAAMLQINEAFRDDARLYRIGVDSQRFVFWLHYHFPEKAAVMYADVITQLERETGWHISFHAQAHQKALLEVAQRLLPAHSHLIKKAWKHETQTLDLHYNGPLQEEQCQRIQQQFEEETGWHLSLHLS